MIKLNNYIIEKLKVTSNSKVNSSYRNLNNIEISKDLLKTLDPKSMMDPINHSMYMKIVQAFKKNVNPKEIYNTIYARHSLLIRWLSAIELGWKECYDLLRKSIIEHNYYTEDELDGYILNKYNEFKKYPWHQKKNDYYLKYLKEFNVKT